MRRARISGVLRVVYVNNVWIIQIKTTPSQWFACAPFRKLSAYFTKQRADIFHTRFSENFRRFGNDATITVWRRYRTHQPPCIVLTWFFLVWYFFAAVRSFPTRLLTWKQLSYVFRSISRVERATEKSEANRTTHLLQYSSHSKNQTGLYLRS